MQSKIRRKITPLHCCKGVFVVFFFCSLFSNQNNSNVFLKVVDYLEKEDDEQIRENQEDIENMKGGIGVIGFIVAVLTLAGLICAWLRRNAWARRFRMSQRRITALQNTLSQLRRRLRRNDTSPRSRPPSRDSIYRPSVSSPIPGPSNSGAAAAGAAAVARLQNNNATYVQPKTVKELKVLQARHKDESGAADGEALYESINLQAESSLVNSSIPPGCPPPLPPVPPPPRSRPRVPKTLDATKIKNSRRADFESSQTSLKQVVPTQNVPTENVPTQNVSIQASLNLSPASSFSSPVENNSHNSIRTNNSTPSDDDDEEEEDDENERDSTTNSSVSHENAARLSDDNTDLSHDNLHENPRSNHQLKHGTSFDPTFGTSTPKADSKLNSLFQTERYSLRDRDSSLCYNVSKMQQLQMHKNEKQK